MKVKNFEIVCKELQGKLENYLELKGISTEKNFKCLNPNHNDNNPSMSLIKPEGIRVYCHSCSCVGDLFDVCSWIDKKPLTGQPFITETLPYLAEMFDVKIEHSELTEDEQYQLDTYRAYRHASEYITSWSHEEMPLDVKTEIERRKWPLSQELQKLGVGYVNDKTAFRTHLKGIGFSASFLDDIDLDRKDIFSSGHLIFTIKDEHGRPIGFAARLLNEENKDAPKYVNQKTTGVKCNIYQKGKRLYGLDVALSGNKHQPVYIVEGYADALTPQIYGFNRVVATCGTSLTDDHIFLLKENGIYDIVLAYDNDEAGQTRMLSILDNKLANHKDMKVSVLLLPDEKDPDAYIRKHGIEKFRELKPLSAFQWRLNQFEESIEPEIICQKMMPFIVSEPSHISQEKMILDLSRFTGFSQKTLQSELQRLLDNREQIKDRERSLIVDRMIKELKSNPSSAEQTLQSAQTQLFGLKVKYDEDTMSEEATLKFLTDIKEKEEKVEANSVGFDLGQDLVDYQQATLGDWKGTFHCIGGKANAGKSSFLCKLGYEIASRESNNAIVIYHTIDDSAEQLMPKWVCIAEGSTELDINHVKSPNYYKDKVANHNILLAKREGGYQKVLDLIRTGRIVVKDASHGASLSYIESLIKYYSEKYPDRRIVFILDNLHKIRDIENIADERVKWKTASQQVKHLATTYGIAIVSTVEYTKLPAGTKPSNDNISETVQLEYDANLIAHLWNGCHELGDKATPDMYHTTVGPNGPERWPIVEMAVGKNKITSFKSKIYFKFFPASSNFYRQPLEVVQTQQSQVQQQKQNKRRREVEDITLF